MSTGGRLFNVNADSAASSLAAALRASSLEFITDVEGLMDAEGKVVAALNADDAHALITAGIVRGGMLPKLSAALDAMSAGVTSVTIGATKVNGYAVAGLRGFVGATTPLPRNCATAQPGDQDASS
jgi:acetylglutamate kinase